MRPRLILAQGDSAPLAQRIGVVVPVLAAHASVNAVAILLLGVLDGGESIGLPLVECFALRSLLPSLSKYILA